MAFYPDFSDSDDGALSDDCDYDNFKVIKKYQKIQSNVILQ